METVCYLYNCKSKITVKSTITLVLKRSSDMMNTLENNLGMTWILCWLLIFSPWDKRLLGEHRKLYPCGLSSEKWPKPGKNNAQLSQSLHAENHTCLFLVLQLSTRIQFTHFAPLHKNLPSGSPPEAHFNKQTSSLVHKELIEYHTYCSIYALLHHSICATLCHCF